MLQQHNEYIWHMKFIIHMHIYKKWTNRSWYESCRPIKPFFVCLFVCLFVCFFTWNFINRIKQTFLQINLFVTCSNRARPNSAMIDWFVENWEEYSLPSDVMYDCRDGPMDLLLIYLFCMQLKFWWLGHLGKMISPWKESVAGKETVQDVWGDLLCRVPAMWYYFIRAIIRPKLASNFWTYVCWEISQ